MTRVEDKIKAYIKSANENPDTLHFIFCTYHSSERVYKNTKNKCMTV